MNNAGIAKILREMSLFYALENVPYKPAVYEEAANSIAALDEPVSKLLKKSGVRGVDALPGIGEAIAKHIVALVQHGEFREHAVFVRRYPFDIVGLCSIEGVGPKTALTLYHKFGIRTVSQLEHAVKRGRLRGFGRIGERAEKQISSGLAHDKTSKGRHLLGDVLPITRSIEEQLLAVKGVHEAVTAGSVRRRQETIGDIDIVVTAKDSAVVFDAVSGFPEVSRVLERGKTKIVLSLRNGMHADIRVVAPESFGAALQYFTGDKKHSVETRKIAAKQGYKLNEYGLWKGKKNVASRTEEEVYSRLGLMCPPPEIRLGDEELVPSKKNSDSAKLPVLISYSALRGDMQVQTSWTDGAASISEMAEAARKAGLSYIAITDHTKSLGMTHGLREKDLVRQGREIAKLNREYRGKFHIFHGAEVNILKDGSLDIDDATLSSLDVVGVSVHSGFGMSRSAMTERIIRAMQNPHVDILFHPTGRLLLRREPYEVDIDAVIAAARETGTALEVNASPDRLDLRGVFIRAAVQAGVKLFINSDAHAPEHFEWLEYGIGQARRGWATRADVVNTRNYSDMKEWLDTPKNKR